MKLDRIINPFTLCAPRIALLLISIGLTSCAVPRTSVQAAAVAEQVQRDYAIAELDWQSPFAPAWLAQRLSNELTPEAAVQIALRNHPKMRMLYADLGVANADLIDATRISNPEFDWSRLKQTDSTNLSNLSFGLNQSLSDLLMLSARKKLARTELARTSAEITAEVSAMILQAQTHYWMAVAAQQNQSLRVLSFEAASNSAALAQALHKAGNISAKQLASEAAEAALAAIEKQRADGKFAGAKAALLLTLGLPADDPRVRLPAAMAPIASGVEPLNVLQTRALTQRADLQTKRLGVSAFAQYLSTSRRWRWFSDLHVGAERERETDGEKLRGLNFSLSLPIFNQGQSGVVRAGAWLTRAQAELAMLELEVQSEVQLAHAGLLLHMQLLRTYQSELIPAREKVVEESQKQYNYMLIGAFDLILAKREEYQSYSDAINAARDYWIRRAMLESAIGGELQMVPLSESGSSVGAPALTKSLENHQHDSVDMRPAAKAYVCPMHPEVQSDKPGSCPICTMDLVPKKSTEAKSTDAKSSEVNPHEGHDHE